MVSDLDQKSFKLILTALLGSFLLQSDHQCYFYFVVYFTKCGFYFRVVTIYMVVPFWIIVLNTYLHNNNPSSSCLQPGLPL